MSVVEEGHLGCPLQNYCFVNEEYRINVCSGGGFTTAICYEMRKEQMKLEKSLRGGPTNGS